MKRLEPDQFVLMDIDRDGVPEVVGQAMGDDWKATVTAIDPVDDEIRWTVKLGDHDDGPVVAGRTLVFAYEDEKTLVALEAATGSVRWRAPVGRPLEAYAADHEFPALCEAPDAVYVASGAGMSAKLSCLGLSDGVERWSTPIQAPGSVFTVMSSTLVVGTDEPRLLFFRSESPKPVASATADRVQARRGAAYAIQATYHETNEVSVYRVRDAHLLRKATVKGFMEGLPTEPAIVRGCLYTLVLGVSPGTLQVVRLPDGARGPQLALSGSAALDLFAVGDLLVAKGLDEQGPLILGIDTETMRERWRCEGDLEASFSFDDDAVYLSKNESTRAIDALTGQVRWERAIGLAQARGGLVAGSERDGLVVLTADRGERVYPREEGQPAPRIHPVAASPAPVVPGVSYREAADPDPEAGEEQLVEPEELPPEGPSQAPESGRRTMVLYAGGLAVALAILGLLALTFLR